MCQKIFMAIMFPWSWLPSYFMFLKKKEKKKKKCEREETEEKSTESGEWTHKRHLLRSSVEIRGARDEFNVLESMLLDKYYHKRRLFGSPVGQLMLL